MLVKFGTDLPDDQLQFGYKAKSGTDICSWTAMETVNYYLRGDSSIWIVSIDCRKAFNLVRWDILFESLYKCLTTQLVRLLLVAYITSTAYVKWGESSSEMFLINSGTAQGHVLSPVLWSVYVFPLIQRLRSLVLGCHTGEKFFGTVLYCDDMLLLAPSRTAAQSMLSHCEAWAVENCVQFSTHPNPEESKTKIMVCGMKSTQNENLQPLTLLGTELPYVGRLDHLGHILTSSANAEVCAKTKHARYINKVTEVQDCFQNCHPNDVLQASKVYANSWYGTNLWNLDSPEAKKAGVTKCSYSVRFPPMQF